MKRSLEFILQTVKSQKRLFTSGRQLRLDMQFRKSTSVAQWQGKWNENEEGKARGRKTS